MPNKPAAWRLPAAIVALAAVSLAPVAANAASAAVQSACADDYFAYCSQHDPDGPGVRACMKANGRRLSQRCIDALVAAGEVSKPSPKRRLASSRR